MYKNIAITSQTHKNEWYHKLKPEVNAKYKSLEGEWYDPVTTNLGFTIKKYICALERGHYNDMCRAYNILHPDFKEPYTLRVGGTIFDNINNLDKIFFLFTPDAKDVKNTSNQVYVSGYLHVVDNNTLRMEILGVVDIYETTIRTLKPLDIRKAPAEVLERVAPVLRNNLVITFKRKIEGTTDFQTGG